MGASYHHIASFETLNGIKVPKDSAGHYLDWRNKRRKEATALTDPYGGLTYAIGSSDDFHCFDFGKLPDDRYIIHAVVNSETGHFIQDASYAVVASTEAIDAALAAVDTALEWASDNKVCHGSKGWRQDPYYFVRSVAAAVKDPRIAWWRGGRIVPQSNRIAWMEGRIRAPCPR